MSESWRYRTCPHCHREHAASAFGYVGTYRPAWDSGTPAKRRCPGCGYEALTSAFKVTRDTRSGYMAESEEWRAEYNRVLGSARWKKLRLTVAQQQRWRCGNCGQFGGVTRSTLELHHHHYRTLGNESPSDVVALCRTCHSNADEERSARGESTSASRLWSARFVGWAETVGIDPDAPGAEERFEAWLEAVES